MKKLLFVVFLVACFLAGCSSAQMTHEWRLVAFGATVNQAVQQLEAAGATVFSVSGNKLYFSDPDGTAGYCVFADRGTLSAVWLGYTTTDWPALYKEVALDLGKQWGVDDSKKLRQAVELSKGEGVRQPGYFERNKIGFRCLLVWTDSGDGSSVAIMPGWEGDQKTFFVSLMFSSGRGDAREN